MPTVEENKNEKRSKLMDAAHSLFTSGSALKPPTIDEVVKLAGVARVRFISISKINTSLWISSF